MLKCGWSFSGLTFCSLRVYHSVAGTSQLKRAASHRARTVTWLGATLQTWVVTLLPHSPDGIRKADFIGLDACVVAHACLGGQPANLFQNLVLFFRPSGRKVLVYAV